MEKISVISGDQTLNGEKIRYIELDRAKYIVYTLNEIDEDKYEKLYINKFVDNEEDLISDGNWDELKKKIPTIVKQIKSKNIVDFSDLDFDDISKVSLNYSRAFKLKVDIVNSLKKESSKEEVIVNEKKGDSDVTEKETSIENTSEVIEKNDSLEQTKEDDEKSSTVMKSSDDLDEFLNNISGGNNKKENRIIEGLNESEIEIQQLKEELEKEKKTNDMLQNKIISLEVELKQDKELLNQIKIMVEKS